MDVSVRFSNNQIHEARTREDRENLNAQMEKDSPWIVVYRSPSHTHHSWKLGHRQVRFRQRDEFEAQIQWLISSVRQRLAKGCLVLVEGTWFNEDTVLTALSGVADSITGETVEVLREMSPQLDTAWGTASTRIKMVLKAEPQHQTSIWKDSSWPLWKRPQIAMLTRHIQQKHTKRMFSNEDQSMTRPEIRGSQCPEQNCLKLRKWNRKKICVARHDRR